MISQLKSPQQDTQIQTVLAMAHHNYGRNLNKYASFKLHNKFTGEDLVQATFVKTWAYLVKGGKIELMKAFLYHVLNDLIVDEYRKHKTTSLDVLLEKGFELSASESWHPPLNILDTKTALPLIYRLPEKYKKVIHMKYVQDLSLKEISLLTGQSKNAVAVQMHRGLQKLKRLYSQP